MIHKSDMNFTDKILNYVLNSENPSIDADEIITYTYSLQWCQEMATMLIGLKNLAGNRQPTTDQGEPGGLDLTQSVMKYYQEALTANEAATLLQQLQTFAGTREMLSSILSQPLVPSPPKIENQAATLLGKFSLTEKVLEVMPPAPAKPSWFKKLLELIKAEISSLFMSKSGSILAFPRLKPVLILLFAGIFCGGGILGPGYYKTDYQLNRVENLLHKHHKIFISGKPRMSGGYEATRLGKKMAPPNSPPFLTEASSRISKAREHGADQYRSELLLAQIELIQNRPSVADSILKSSIGAGRETADVLNDLGVAAFASKNIDVAEQKFQEALQLKPQLREAKYNLALTQEKLGKSEKALQTIKEYLKNETDPHWRDAAESLLNRVQNKTR